MLALVLGAMLAGATGGPVTETYKDQYCTDPRTNNRHAAYTEWADAYSCTRHRCQPGGRNLAIYTVGCKRVEAPESAIECEEVVEDTNMQFPFCCTRLRCLVVVRGEVWTRVLGQPWESLPAAPWSHMYKMKKPPPADGSFPSKPVAEQGPIYELTDSESDGPKEKVMRTSKADVTDKPCNDPVLRSAPQPDIVIALSTNPDPKVKSLDMDINGGSGPSRHKRVHKEVMRANPNFEDEKDRDRDRADEIADTDDANPTSEKAIEPMSDERFYNNAISVTQKQHHQPWTEAPQPQWNEHDIGGDTEIVKENSYAQQDYAEHKPDQDKPSNLQALVDAIGSRMRDIEHVVQRMSEKVHQPGDENAEKGEVMEEEPGYKRHKASGLDVKEYGKTKKPGDDDHYKRFSVRNRGSKYLHASDSTTDKPLFIEDNNLNGYFSDASNSVLRRSNVPKSEPAVQTYMAPVETRRRTHVGDLSEEKKHKKHHNKKKKGKHHKKHRNKKRFNKLSSAEVDKNVVSLEDSSAAGP